MIKEDVRMKKWAPRVLLDLVAVGISDGNGCHACDRETVCRI